MPWAPFAVTLQASGDRCLTMTCWSAVNYFWPALGSSVIIAATAVLSLLGNLGGTRQTTLWKQQLPLQAVVVLCFVSVDGLLPYVE